MSCIRLAESTGRKISRLRTIAQLCRAISSQLRHVLTIVKIMLNSNIGPLTAEIGWRVWGTEEYFNGFRVFASLLHRRRSTEVNQTLHGVWPSSGLVHYMYIFGALVP